jgi:hypothetical protein
MSVTRCAKAEGISRQGMLKRLNKLNERANGRLLRRELGTNGGRLEVCIEVLRELRSYDPDQAERELRAVHGRIDEVGEKVTALRDAHHSFRRRAEKRMATHDEQLAALKQLSEAAAKVSQAFARVAG